MEKYYGNGSNVTKAVDRVTAGYIFYGDTDITELSEGGLSKFRKDNLGFEEIGDKFPYQVSGGRKQRCACARALINQPKLLLADEPTGALDSRSAQTLLETFTKMNQEFSATISMVTHDAFSASYCKRILFLKDGKIFHELIRADRTRREFLNEILDVLSLTGGELSDVREACGKKCKTLGKRLSCVCDHNDLCHGAYVCL